MLRLVEFNTRCFDSSVRARAFFPQALDAKGYLLYIGGADLARLRPGLIRG